MGFRPGPMGFKDRPRQHKPSPFTPPFSYPRSKRDTRDQEEDTEEKTGLVVALFSFFIQEMHDIFENIYAITPSRSKNI